MFLLIIFTLPVVTCVWWAVAHHFLKGQRWARVGVAIATLLTLAYIILVLASRIGRWPVEIPRLVNVWGYSWYLFTVPVVLIPMLLGCGIYGVVRLVRSMRLRAKVAPPPQAAEADATPTALLEQRISRRRILQVGVGAGPLILNAGAMAKALYDADEFRVHKLDVSIPNLPAALEGFTIAHITDIHVGHFTRGRILEQIVDSTNALNADLAVMTGDLIDSQLSDLPAGIEVLKAVRAKHGLYVIEGNHDLFESRERFEKSLVDADLNFLLNESAVVNVNGLKLGLMGLRWGMPGERRSGANYGENLDMVMRSPSVTDFSLLLSHHPDVFDQAAAQKIPLVLSGHTHGGQIMLTKNIGAGPAMFQYWSGLYARGDSRLVVSNGVGNWMPLRINAPAEIVQITLRKELPLA